MSSVFGVLSFVLGVWGFGFWVLGSGFWVLCSVLRLRADSSAFRGLGGTRKGFGFLGLSSVFTRKYNHSPPVKGLISNTHPILTSHLSPLISQPQPQSQPQP